jgi:septal ring factor EnvC (AmiA/AmiB activator)
LLFWLAGWLVVCLSNLCTCTPHAGVLKRLNTSLEAELVRVRHRYVDAAVKVDILESAVRHSQGQRNNTWKELMRTESQLENTQKQLTRTKSQLNFTRAQLQASEDEVYELQAETERLNGCNVELKKRMMQWGLGDGGMAALSTEALTRLI